MSYYKLKIRFKFNFLDNKTGHNSFISTSLVEVKFVENESPNMYKLFIFTSIGVILFYLVLLEILNMIVF